MTFIDGSIWLISVMRSALIVFVASTVGAISRRCALAPAAAADASAPPANTAPPRRKLRLSRELQNRYHKLRQGDMFRIQ